MAHRRWKVLQHCELIAGITGQSAFNARLRCPFTLSGTGARPVPSVAAPPRFDTRTGQRCVRRHVGRQAAEVAWWWSLHEDLHAATQALDELAWELHVATQMPAQLVELAAACEQRRRLGWCGPGGGPAGVLGEGLARWPGKGLAMACCCPRQGSCRGSCGFPRQGFCRGSPSSSPHLILNIPRS